MSGLIKHQEQKEQLDYFKSLVSIASKKGSNNMAPEEMLNIMLTARDLGISPMKAINGGFYIVNGKISMSTALMADRIRKEGHSIKIPEWTSEKCVIIGVRRDNGDSIKFEYTMEDARSAGLTGSPTWKKFPKQMLYNRAMSVIARTLFPDVVGNAYSEDEKWDILNIPAEKRPEEDPDVMQIKTCPQQSQEIDANHSPLERLREHLKNDGLPVEKLDAFLQQISDKKQESVDKIVESALRPLLYPAFKSLYERDLSKSDLPDQEAV